MSQPEKQLTEKEGLGLITKMISKTRDSFMEKEYRLFKKEQNLADV